VGKYDRLYEFIPYLEAVTQDNAVRWGGGTRNSEGIFTMPYPIYDEWVEDMIETIYELDLLDNEYMVTIQSYNIHTSGELENAFDHADGKLTIALLT
jgi:hypothetical protein